LPSVWNYWEPLTKIYFLALRHEKQIWSESRQSIISFNLLLLWHNNLDTLLFVPYLNMENLWAAFLRLFWWWDQRKFAVNCPLFLDQYRYDVPVPDISASHQDEYD
jgi:hypothetical protein